MSGALAGVARRTFEVRDLEFLYQVYAASRAREMVLLPHWSDGEKEAFLRDQFSLQHTHYQAHYPQARYQVILKEEVAIGRLYVAPLDGEIRLMDIALLPPWRGLGIGSALVREVMEEGRGSGRLVSLHVEADNPARRLYRRLGFVDVGEVGVYRLMHWHPPGFGDGD
ncbi:MAG: GNAT family N-acetyltransferase [Candidatus Competibacteraceae bacterium]|nr:GNAT family N-acetyltransferase [Candidatus Competibacteraceae bacterium]